MRTQLKVDELVEAKVNPYVFNTSLVTTVVPSAKADIRNNNGVKENKYNETNTFK